MQVGEPVDADRGDRRRRARTSRRASPSSVALVTGASAGIGRAFAVGLARRGHDLVLVARDAARLEELASELATRTASRPRCSPPTSLDRRRRSPAWRARLADVDRPVDLLVNNAGFGTYGRFAELDVDREVRRDPAQRASRCVRLTHAALGAMVERGRGGILNVVVARGATSRHPINATYGATKAFVQQLHPRGARGARAPACT